jgi:hypothetical protein
LHLVTGPLLVSAGHWSGSGEPDLGEPVVDRVPVVVQGGCLQDDASGANENGRKGKCRR